MKKILVFLSLVFFLSSTALAQGWIQSYDGDSLITPVGQKTTDGGFILGGHVNYNYNFPFDNQNIAGGYKLIKTDSSGNVIWANDYYPSLRFSVFDDLKETSDGGFIASLTKMELGADFTDSIMITKTSNTGQLEWSFIPQIEYPFQEVPDSKCIPIMEDSDGNFVFAYPRIDNTSSIRYPHLIKLDSDGHELWDSSLFSNSFFNLPSFFKITDIIQTTNEDYVIVGTGFILRTDKNGNLLWTLPSSSFLRAVIENDDGDLLAVGENSLIKVTMNNSVPEISEQALVNNSSLYLTTYDIKNNSNGGYILTGSYRLPPGADVSFYRPFLIELYSNFNVKFFKKYNRAKIGEGTVVEVDGDNGYFILGGKIYSTGMEIYYSAGSFILRTDIYGNLYSNIIKGNIFRDDDLNCALSTNEANIEGWMVRATGHDDFFGYTDHLGNYEIECDSGTYAVQTFLPNGLWDLDCQPNGYNINFSSFYNEIDSLDFPIAPIYDCSFMIVAIDQLGLRQCNDNALYVFYCNQGLADEPNTIIEVELDSHISYLDSSIPLTSQNGNILTFNIGNVAWGDCGEFTINTFFNCDSTILGQTHCNEAHIFPDTTCIPVSNNWDGSEVAVFAECESDSIAFRIENIGSGDMLQERTYYVFEDHVMKQSSEFQLASGDAQIIKFEANGSTWHLIAHQVEGHPSYSIYESQAIEGCVPLSGSPFTTGLYNGFDDYSEEPYNSINCTESTDSYSSNYMSATPYGIGNAHRITNNDPLEYKINFRNTTANTISKLVIENPISLLLDPTTILPLTSSHPYTMTISSNGVLTFTFNNIMLPSSAVNEIASHGFITFQIQQKEGNSIGTQINNEAFIYFDLNSPINTNATFHTIGENQLITIIKNEPEVSGIHIEVFPNPLNKEATFRISHPNIHQFTFDLYDITGKRIESILIGNEFIFQRKNIPKGIYFYRIQSLSGQNINAGKIIIQ